MAEKVELIIEVQNLEAIKNIKETQKATEDLNNTAVKGAKEQEKAIADLEKQINELWQTQKKGFSDQGKMNEYTKKMDELKKKHQELTGASKETAKATEDVKDSADDAGSGLGSLAKKAGLVAAGIAFLTKLMHGVIEAFKDTTIGMNLMTGAGEFWRQMTYNIATGNFNMLKSFEGVAVITKQINDLRQQERADLVETAKKREQYNQVYFESSNRLLTDEERLEKMNEAMKIHNELIDIELRNAAEELIIVKNQLINRPKSNKLLDEQAKLEAQLLSIQGRRWSETKRLESQRTALEEQMHEKKINAWHDEIEAENKAYEEKIRNQEAYQRIAEKLIEEYDKSQIDSLEGKDKLIAQREFGIKQIAELKKQIALLGPLTDDQIKMLQVMADNVWKEYYKALAEDAKITKATPDQQKAISEALLGDMDELPGLVKKDVESAQATIDNIVKQRAAEEPFSIWKLIGIDTESEEGQKAIEGIREGADVVKGIIDEIYQKRVEDATRERELLDQRISDLESSLDLEIQLMEAGYASNVTAKKKELEELKKQRETALKAEQEAQKKQAAVQRLQQGISLATSVANILSNYTSMGPWGLILAAIAIAALWAIWSSAKTKAATATKMAEGASGTDTGIITGRSHNEGGERFLDHIEVERGEAFGVLSRKASDKYGKVFHEMVSSFNKDEMPEFVTPSVNNSVMVENSGPNSRLDKVIKEQKKLNESFLKQSHLYNMAGKKIVKSGNNIRIVG